MVKNDSLFSYVAPGNIVAWILMPLRYVMPIRQFVLLNRTVIKLTHFPILFVIFLYEKYILANYIYEPTDLIDHNGRGKHNISFADPANRASLFSPNVRAREESFVGMQKDRALEEVFRRPPDASTVRNQRRQERKNTLTAIRNWMDQADDDAGSPLTRWPTLGTLDGRTNMSQRRRSMSRDFPSRFRQFSDVRSAASDPADLFSNSGFPAVGLRHRPQPIEEQQQQFKDQTDADGDDELMTNDEEDEANTTMSHSVSKHHRDEVEDYFAAPPALRHEVAAPSSPSSSSHRQTAVTSPRGAAPPRRRGLHDRTLSTNTILYAPQESSRHGPSPSSIPEQVPPATRSRPRTSRLNTSVGQTGPSGIQSPRKAPPPSFTPTRPRPIPSRSAPNRAALLQPRQQQQQQQQQNLRGPSSVDVDAASEMGLLDAGHDFGGMVPSSFATQMALATGQLKGLGLGRGGRGGGGGGGISSQGERDRDRESTDRLNRLVLARMKALEEGFADVVREMRGMRSTAPSSQNSDAPAGPKSDGSRRQQQQHRRQHSAGLNTPATATATPSVAGRSAGSSGAGTGKSSKRSSAGRAKGKGKGKAKEEAGAPVPAPVAVPETETETETESESEAASENDATAAVSARVRRRGSSF